MGRPPAVAARDRPAALTRPLHPPTRADAAVIICAYSLERWPLLCRVLEAVAVQSRPAEDVIVVVDGNRELYDLAVGQARARVVMNRYGGGASGGRMTGADAADAAVLVFLDDDAIPDRDWLAQLLRPYAIPGVIGTGGHLGPMWETARPRWLPPEYDWIVGCSFDARERAQPQEIRNPIAANMSIRADVFASAGGMALALGRSDVGGCVSGTAEETELSIRARRLYPDGHWAYAPSARVRHHVPASRATWRYFRSRCALEGGSKAILTGLTGTETGLSSERAYVRRTLPRALARELGHGLAGDLDGWRRAFTIIAGLAFTASAYVAGRVALRVRARGATSAADG
jgi:cellulose synthase/poly-beta-1,6-N-acetylglucosamine synthase-like glycosyltransferase